MIAKGIGFKVKCKEDLEIYKEIKDSEFLEVVIFIPDIIYTAISDKNKLIVIDRNHRNIELPNDIFNNHFNLI